MKILGVFATLLFAAAVALHGQELVRQSGSLTSQDEKHENGAPIHWYEVTANPGVRVAVRVASVDFTPGIVLEPEGAEAKGFSGRDGSAGASFTATSPTRLRIGVTSLSTDAPHGSYTIRAAAVPLEAAITVGAMRGGELSYDDETTEDGARVDWWPVSLHKGDRVAVVVRSEDFAPSIVGTLPEDGDITTEQAPDGYAVVRLPVAKDETISFGISSQSGGGNYHITVLVPKEPTPIKIGEPVEGRLDDRSDMLSGQPMQAYLVHGQLGAHVTIDLESEDFDTVLVAQDGSGAIEQNDDISNDNLNSHLEHTFTSNGDLEIRVYAIDAESRGAFNLTVREQTE